jgi:hypothetical protein
MMRRPVICGMYGEDHYVVYAGCIKIGGSRSWRNNNPGNLEAGSFTQAHGAISADSRLAIFPDCETGLNALHNLLKTPTYQGLSIQAAMVRYAPPSKNDTAAYIADVHQLTGIPPQTLMSSLTEDQIGRLALAIQQIEGYVPGTAFALHDPDAPAWTQSMIQSMVHAFQNRSVVAVSL